MRVALYPPFNYDEFDGCSELSTEREISPARESTFCGNVYKPVNLEPSQKWIPEHP